MTSSQPRIEDGIFVGVPVNVREEEGGIFSGVPLVGGGVDEEEIYTVLPLTAPIRRRRTLNSSSDEDDISSLEDDDDDNNNNNNRRNNNGGQQQGVSNKVVLESFCLFVLFCILCFTDWRIPAPRLVGGGGGGQRWYWLDVCGRGKPILPPRCWFTGPKAIAKDLSADKFNALLQEQRPSGDNNEFILVLFETPSGRGGFYWGIGYLFQEGLCGYPNLSIVKVNCENQPEICRQHTILTPLTIRLYSSKTGAPIEEIPFDRNDMINHVRQKIQYAWRKPAGGGENALQPGPFPGPDRSSTLPTLVRANSTQVLLQEETAIVIFPELYPSSLASTTTTSSSSSNSGDYAAASRAKSQWWIRIWEDQSYQLERRNMYTTSKARIFLATDGGGIGNYVPQHQTFAVYNHGILSIPDYTKPLQLEKRKEGWEAARWEEQRAADVAATTRQLGLPRLNNKQSLDAFLWENSCVLVLFVDPDRDDSQPMITVMNNVAKRLRGDVAVAMSVQEPQFGVSSKPPTIRLYLHGRLHPDEYQYNANEQGREEPTIIKEEAITSFVRERLSDATNNDERPREIPQLYYAYVRGMLVGTGLVLLVFVIVWLLCRIFAVTVWPDWAYESASTRITNLPLVVCFLFFLFLLMVG